MAEKRTLISPGKPGSPGFSETKKPLLPDPKIDTELYSKLKLMLIDEKDRAIVDEMRKSWQVIGQVGLLLLDPDPNIRFGAVSVLETAENTKRINLRDAIPQMIKVLSDGSPQIRLISTRTLPSSTSCLPYHSEKDKSDWNDLFSALGKNLSDSDFDVKIASAYALHDIRKDRDMSSAVPALVSEMGSSNSDYSRKISAALGHSMANEETRATAMPLLIQSLSNPSENVRLDSLRALNCAACASVGMAVAIRPLLKVASEDSRFVRSKAELTLKNAAFKCQPERVGGMFAAIAGFTLGPGIFVQGEKNSEGFVDTVNLISNMIESLKMRLQGSRRIGISCECK